MVVNPLNEVMPREKKAIQDLIQALVDTHLRPMQPNFQKLLGPNPTAAQQACLRTVSQLCFPAHPTPDLSYGLLLDLKFFDTLLRETHRIQCAKLRATGWLDVTMSDVLIEALFVTLAPLNEVTNRIASYITQLEFYTSMQTAFASHTRK